eukprot:745810-Pelagomonas_calceolata.AAC.1
MRSKHSERPAAPRYGGTSARGPAVSNGTAKRPQRAATKSSSSSSSSSSGEPVSLGVKRSLTSLQSYPISGSAAEQQQGLMHPESK